MFPEVSNKLYIHELSVTCAVIGDQPFQVHLFIACKGDWDELAVPFLGAGHVFQAGINTKIDVGLEVGKNIRTRVRCLILDERLEDGTTDLAAKFLIAWLITVKDRICWVDEEMVVNKLDSPGLKE
jgi:hypothetical protein